MSGFPLIAQRMFNTPLLVDPAKAQAILMGFGARVLNGHLVMPSLDIPVDRAERATRLGPRASIIGDTTARRRRERGDKLYQVVDGVAVVDVTGSLVHRGSWIGESSGVTSYEGLHAQIDAIRAEASSLRGVALEVDTFGGEVAGVFDLADAVRALSSVLPVWAFVAENALSAGYAIASQAERIIVPRTGEVGSIGVLCMHVDYSRQLEDDGIVVTLVKAGGHKTDGNPFEPLPEDVFEEWSADAEALRQTFAQTVAAGRDGRLSAEAALATEARCFRGEEAVRLGLADEVSDLRGAFASFVASVNGRRTATTIGAIAGADKKETTMLADIKTDPQAETPAENTIVTPPAPPEPETETAAVAAPAAPVAGATGIPAAAAAELAEVAAQAAALGMNVDLADAFRKGTTAEQLRASVLAGLAAKSSETAVSAQHQVRVQAESPIVAAAKKAAAAAKK